MLHRLRPRLSYANVISTLALFLVLAGGIAFALDRNSVKSKHIKNGQVKLADAQESAFGRGSVFGAIDSLGPGGGSGSSNYFPDGNNESATGRHAVVPVALRLRDLQVEVATEVTAGSWEFALGRFDPDGSGPLNRGLSCEISAGETSCKVSGPSPKFSPGEDIRLKAIHSGATGGVAASFSWRAASP